MNDAEYSYSRSNDVWTSNDANNNDRAGPPGVLMSPPPVVFKISSSTLDAAQFTRPPTFVGRLKTRFRFLLSVLMLFCLTSIWSNIICFNFALICITPHDDEAAAAAGALPSSPPTSIFEADYDDEDHTHNPEVKGAHFSTTQKMFLTAAVAVSATVANLIVVQVITRRGIRMVFIPLGLLSAVGTALMPVGLKSGFTFTVILRCLQGVAFSANFPVIGAFTNRWAYHKQNGMIVSLLVAYIQLAPTISDPLSGALCGSSLGWESVFYVHSIWTALVFALFAVCFRNNPGKHPLVGDHEFHKVTVNKPIQTKKEMKKIPYKSILQSWSVWAIWVAGVGNFFCVNAIFLYSPNYLHYVLDMDVSSTGAMAAVPAVLQFLVKLSGGTTSDKVKCLGETNKLRMYNTLAFFGSATVFIVLSFLDTENSMLCFIVLSIATGFLGLTTGGFFKNGPLLAQQYSQFVTGNISQTITLTMIVVSFLIGNIAPDNTPTQWRTVFWVIAAVLIVCNVLFCVFCTGHPAEWTKIQSLQQVSPTTSISVVDLETRSNSNRSSTRIQSDSRIQHLV